MRTSCLWIAFFCFLTACECEKDISQNQDVSFILNKNFMLRESVYLVQNERLQLCLLELPGTYGLPSLKDYQQHGVMPQKSHMKILEIIPKSRLLTLKKVTHRRPFFKEEQYLMWVETSQGEAVINPVFSYLSLPEKPHSPIFEEPHFLTLLSS